MPPTKGKFHVELESLRGIAALLVAGFHCAQTPVLIGGQTVFVQEVAETNWVWQFLHRMHEQFVYSTELIHPGVLIFFVLSGFLLTESLFLGPSGIRRAGGRFFLARLFRIYPGIVGALLVFWLAHFFFGPALGVPQYSLGTLLVNVLLIDISMLGVLWTLQVEFLAIPLIFLTFVLRRYWGLLAATALALLFTSLAFTSWWARLLSHGPSRTAWLYTFLFGALAFHLGKFLAPRLRGRAATVIFLAAVLCFFGADHLLHQQWLTVTRAIAACALIVVLTFGPQLSASALLRARPLRFLGRVSYSFYLLHPLTLRVIWHIQNFSGNGSRAAFQQSLSLSRFGWPPPSPSRRWRGSCIARSNCPPSGSANASGAGPPPDKLLSF